MSKTHWKKVVSDPNFIGEEHPVQEVVHVLLDKRPGVLLRCRNHNIFREIPVNLFLH